jgi:hypothetical protein
VRTVAAVLALSSLLWAERLPALATEDWTVWVEVEVIPSPKRAQDRITRYFVSRAGESEQRKVFEMEATYSRRAVTVLDDGTVGLDYGTAMFWALPGGLERVDLGGRQVLAGWPDGLLVQDYDLNTHRPVDWIPLKGRTPQRQMAIRITGPKGVRVNSRPVVLRAGSLLCWGDPEVGNRIFDLKTRSLRTLDLHGSPRAFDGVHAVSRQEIVRIADGRRTKLPDFVRIHHLRGGVAYGSDRREYECLRLIALDPEDVSRRKTLHEFEHDGRLGNPRLKPGVCRLGDVTVLRWDRLGLHVIADGGWKLLPWLPGVPG